MTLLYPLTHPVNGLTKSFVVLDIDLSETISVFTGDSHRIHFEPYFKMVYSFIVFGLFSITLLLLYLTGKECVNVFLALQNNSDYRHC